MEIIRDPYFGNCILMRDNKGKIQYLRRANMKDKLNFQVFQEHEVFDNLVEQEKLRRMKYSAFFFVSYYIFFIFVPLLWAFEGHYSKENPTKKEKKEDLEAVLILLGTYMVFGIFLKAFVKNVNKSRTRCPKNFVINFDVWNCRTFIKVTHTKGSYT